MSGGERYGTWDQRARGSSSVKVEGKTSFLVEGKAHVNPWSRDSTIRGICLG